MDIPAALEVLQNAPIEAFRNHYTAIISTILHIEKLVRSLHSGEPTPSDLIQGGIEGECVSADCSAASEITTNDRAHAVNQISLRGSLSSVDLEKDVLPVDPVSKRTDKDRPQATQANQAHRRISPQKTNETTYEHNLGNESNGRETSTEKRGPVADRARDLLESIRSSFSSLLKFSNERQAELPNLVANCQHDRRLYDIFKLDSKRASKATVEEQLFRSVAQRSLALQLSRSEVARGVKRRFDEICDFFDDDSTQKSLHKRRGGHLRNWAKTNLAFADGDFNVIVSALSAGIKQLAVEERLRRRLIGCGLSLRTSGISAVTALSYQKFKDLKLEDIPTFVEMVMADESGVTNSNVPMTSMFDWISPWFNTFQYEYDGRFLPIPELGPPPSKRIHLSNAASETVIPLSERAFRLPSSVVSNPSPMSTPSAEPGTGLSFTSAHSTYPTNEPAPAASFGSQSPWSISQVFSPNFDILRYAVGFDPHLETVSGPSRNFQGEDVSARGFVPWEDSVLSRI